MFKAFCNYETGETEFVEMTAEEVAQKEADAVAALQRRAEEAIADDERAATIARLVDAASVDSIVADLLNILGV
jgi:hypothetical protein